VEITHIRVSIVETLAAELEGWGMLADLAGMLNAFLSCSNACVVVAVPGEVIGTKLLEAINEDLSEALSCWPSIAGNESAPSSLEVYSPYGEYVTRITVPKYSRAFAKTSRRSA
jgi:hypothetical protein